VLRKNGRMAILTPTVLMQKYKDPMTVGNFIEKYEHETKGGKHIDSKFLEMVMNNFFQKVEKRQFIHMTLSLASKPRSRRNSHKKIGSH